jgi:hypothetical protein
MNDVADRVLFPAHFFNSISTVISLFGFWVWLFFSPHNSDVARDLDRTCTKKNDCILSNITAPSTHSCFSRFFLFSGQLFCPSMAGEPPRCCRSLRAELCAIKNSKHGSFSRKPACVGWALHDRDEPSVPSLSHRKGARHDKNVRHFRIHIPHLIFRIYPPDKPPPKHVFLSFLNCNIDDDNDPSVKVLELLEGSLVWEARSLCLVAVGAPAFIIYQPAGLIIAGLGLLVVVVMVLSLVFISFTRNCLDHTLLP